MSEEVYNYETAPAIENDDAPVCRMLRTKNAFGSFDGHLISWDSGESSTAVYWCLRTMETVGPDDNFTHAKTCRKGRSCYEADDE